MRQRYVAEKKKIIFTRGKKYVLTVFKKDFKPRLCQRRRHDPKGKKKKRALTVFPYFTFFSFDNFFVESFPDRKDQQ